MPHVYLVQCVCSLNHVLLVAAFEAEFPDPEAASQLCALVRARLAAGRMASMCEFCGDGSENWQIRIGGTNYRHLADAMLAFQASAEKRIQARNN